MKQLLNYKNNNIEQLFTKINERGFLVGKRPTFWLFCMGLSINKRVKLGYNKMIYDMIYKTFICWKKTKEKTNIRENFIDGPYEIEH